MTSEQFSVGLALVGVIISAFVAWAIARAQATAQIEAARKAAERESSRDLFMRAADAIAEVNGMAASLLWAVSRLATTIANIDGHEATTDEMLVVESAFDRAFEIDHQFNGVGSMLPPPLDEPARCAHQAIRALSLTLIEIATTPADPDGRRRQVREAVDRANVDVIRFADETNAWKKANWDTLLGAKELKRSPWTDDSAAAPKPKLRN
jgi:hypothetical protein